ncbi:hypothetical protein QQS21_010353 [Conoideocrella luteorostrata]|uniref:Apple domain-containing protein n=1 Tax=Conoideocrella luteorostrata TaxID=1105319 RepID=A0AAJ0CHX6_9HYPO|nr:hypothetical protein QQS21_010353 [Conoideocrella luteorostrata]
MDGIGVRKFSDLKLFRIVCGKKHGTQVIYQDTQDSLEECIEACGRLMACHSVDYDAPRKVCYYGKHQGAPTVKAVALEVPTPWAVLELPTQENSNDLAQLELENKFQEYADDIVAQGYSGLIASIDVPEGKFALISGYDNMDQKNEPETKSHFRIGSFTSPFTAVVVLQLIDENKLRLEDTVEH